MKIQKNRSCFNFEKKKQPPKGCDIADAFEWSVYWTLLDPQESSLHHGCRTEWNRIPSSKKVTESGRGFLFVCFCMSIFQKSMVTWDSTLSDLCVMIVRDILPSPAPSDSPISQGVQKWFYKLLYFNDATPGPGLMNNLAWTKPCISCAYEHNLFFSSKWGTTTQ